MMNSVQMSEMNACNKKYHMKHVNKNIQIAVDNEAGEAILPVDNMRTE
jgi:hypothetical protein